MPVRLALVVLLVLGSWFASCSKGIGNNLRRGGPPPSTASSNLPLGLDLGLVPTDPPSDLAIAGVVIPGIGGGEPREVVLLAFASGAIAGDGDGNGTPLAREPVVDTNAADDVFVAAISAQDVETRAFSQSLAGKFRHPRCATCHSMQAGTTQAFASSSQPHAGPLPGPGFPNNDPATCAPCHLNSTLFPVPAWQAPAASFDFRTKTVAELAQAAQNVPVDETEHFVTDPRVLWALDSGILPQVGGRNGIADDDHDGAFEPEDEDGVVRTVPGGSAQFLHEIEDWIASGRVLTTAAAVRDVELASRATGTNTTGNGGSRRPRLKWVPNPTFNPTSAATAAGSNPIGTLYVVFESDASNLTAGDANGVTDVYRAALVLNAEQDATGAAAAGGLNLAWTDANVLVSARDGLTTAGNGASTRPAIGGANGNVVAFQSLATNLVAGFADGNGAGSADVYVRRIGTNDTELVSHQVGNAATGGNGASEAPAVDPTGAGVAFESDASDLIALDTNTVRDVFHALVGGGSPFAKVRSSVTDAGAEATGGASSAASMHVGAGNRVLVAFQSDATDLATGLVAATNVYLFDSDTGATTLLNQRLSPTGDAIGDGPARAPHIADDGLAVAFESEAANIDVLRADDLNRASDVFLVEVPQIEAGVVLPYRVSLTATTGSTGNGASTAPVFGSFADPSSFPVGFVAYTTAATNLGNSDSTNVIVSFVSERSGVFASFSATPPRGAAPLTVTFTDESAGGPTSWQWDFDNDGTVDSTQQNPTFVYTTPGLYTVKLTARNANGEGTAIETDLVLVVGPIVPDFTASVTAGPAPLSVTFTDTSTQSPTSWQWDFEDDGTIDSTAQNPTHVYNTPGTYSVRLIATNEAGDVATTKTDLITANVPVNASFTANPTSGIAPFTVTFTNTTTGGVSYAWNFGDGGTSTATSPSHQYTVGGVYQVTLTATGAGPNNVDTANTNITVNTAVTPSFTMTVGGNPITSAYESTNITFTSTSTGSITSFAWDFDSVANPGALTATTSSVVRNFANTTSSTRTFIVRLQVSGPGGTAATTRTLTIVSDTETATLTPTADSTIYQDLTGNSNGAGTGMVVGRPAGTASPASANFARRALVQFSLASIPAGSTINTAALRLVSDMPVTVNTGTQTITIHRLTQAWTEGTALGTPGIGAATAGNGATWLNRSGILTWTNQGGTFIAGQSGSIANVSVAGTYTSSSLVTDVQNWLNGTVNNNGWILRGNEAAAATAKRFYTREGTSPPELLLNYTRPLP